MNTIIKEGDQTGKLTERVTESAFQRYGYESVDPELLKYSGNKGLDGVFLKGDTVVVNDSKQLSSGGINLSKGNLQTKLEPQMTTGWVTQVAENLKKTADPAKVAVANKILAAMDAGKLQLALSAVDKRTGQLIIVPLKR